MKQKRGHLQRRISNIVSEKEKVKNKEETGFWPCKQHHITMLGSLDCKHPQSYFDLGGTNGQEVSSIKPD